MLKVEMINGFFESVDGVIRKTDRIVFSDADTMEVTTTYESTMPSRVTGRRANVRLPLIVDAFQREPARHLRCFHDGEEVPTAHREDERDLCARWLRARALTDEVAMAHVREKLSSADGYDESKFENDILEACRYTLDEPLYRSKGKLECGRDPKEVWETLSGTVSMVDFLAEMIRPHRFLVALPQRSAITISPQCFTLRFNSPISRYRGSLLNAWRALRRGRENRSELQLWRQHGVKPSANDSSHASSESKMDKWRLARAYLSPVWLTDPLKNITTPENPSNSLVLADGSAMKIDRYLSVEALRKYLHRWRVRWEIPDQTMCYVPVDGISQCRSYHCVMEMPEGVFADSAILRVRNDKGEMIFIEDDDVRPDCVHLHFTRKLSADPESTVGYGPARVQLVLRPTWHNGLRTAVWTQLLTVVTLGILSIRYGQLFGSLDSWFETPKGQGNADAIAALITLTPIAAISWILRPGEHDLTKAIQSRMRIRLIATAVCSFVVALALATGYQHHMPELADTSFVLAVLLWLFTARSSHHSHRRN